MFRFLKALSETKIGVYEIIMMVGLAIGGFVATIGFKKAKAKVKEYLEVKKHVEWQRGVLSDKATANKQLQEEIDALKQANQQLLDDNAKIVMDKEKALEDGRATLLSARAASEQAKQIESAAKTLLATAHREGNASKKRIDELEGLEKTFNNQITCKDNEITCLKEWKKTKEVEITNWSKTLDDRNQTISDLTEKVNDRNQKIQTHENTISQWVAAVEKRDQMIAGQSQKIQDDLARERAEVKRLADGWTYSDSALSQKKTELGNLRIEMAAKTTEIDRLNQSVAGFQSEINRLTTLATERQVEIQRLSQGWNNCDENRRAELAAAQQARQTEETRLTNGWQKAHDELCVVKAQLDEKQRVVANKDQQIAEQTKTIEGFQCMQKEFGLVKADNISFKAQVADRDATINSLNDQNKNLREQHTQQANGLEAARRELGIARTEASQRKQIADDLRIEVDAAYAQRESNAVALSNLQISHTQVQADHEKKVVSLQEELRTIISARDGLFTERNEALNERNILQQRLKTIEASPVLVVYRGVNSNGQTSDQVMGFGDLHTANDNIKWNMGSAKFEKAQIVRLVKEYQHGEEVKV